MPESSSPSRQTLLSVYLNDHLTGASGGVELFRRAAPTQADPAARSTLLAMADEVADDRQALLDLMHQLDVTPQQHRIALGWLAEKVGRLKPNGSLFSRTPLTDLVELEAMRLGVEGKLACWQALEVVAAYDDRIASGEILELEARAQRQLEELETLRMNAAERALTG